MTIPHCDTVRQHPLTSDQALLNRLDELLERGIVLRLWFMFLDEDDLQLPLVLPMDVVGPPGDDDAESIASFIADLMGATGAETAVVVVEWGSIEVADDAVEWMRVATAACAASDSPYRGPFECSPFGVRPLG